MTHPLHHAPANLRRPKFKSAFRLALAGTFLNYLAVCAVAAWSGVIIDHIVAANGTAVWNEPNLTYYSHQALDVPGDVGIGCVFALTGLFTFLLIRRHTDVLLLFAFLSINTFAIIVMLVFLDFGAIEHGLYP